MEIILLKNLDKVGRKFEIVKVKDGYGRNYLIPQGLAIVANKINRNNLDSFKRQESAKLNKKLDAFKAIANKINGQQLTITTKVGTSGKIFGSVTNIQIANALRDQLGVEVDRRDILMPDDHVKMIGKYTAVLDLHPDVDAKIDFEVISDDPELAKHFAEIAAEAALEAAAEASTDH
ncbi:MAG: 50S ribosomal protein L9 [Saprospiraceae bacterium]|nr:50S ribosomal protein L9 [Saprospiraceae bacterium]